MSDKQDVRDLLELEFRRASSVAQVSDALQRLDKHREAGEMSTKEAYEARAYAFRALQELTAGDAAAAEEVIINQLLPVCLVDEPEARIPLRTIRQRLKDWVNQYEMADRARLNQSVLGVAVPRLSAAEPRGACRVVAIIGLRTPEIELALRQITALKDDELGDLALSVSAGLGVPPGRRQASVEQLHLRMSKRFNFSLLGALVSLGEKQSAAALFNYWLKPGGLVVTDMDTSLAINGLRELLDAHSEDVEFADAVWRQLTSLAERNPAQFGVSLFLGSVASSCDSALVFPTMLNWMGAKPLGGASSPRERYLLGLRMGECIRPHQLAATLGCAGAVVEVLRGDACQNTGADLFAKTEEMDVKEKAWETLLRVGCGEALGWLNAAVAGETARFMQGTVIDLLACFRFRPLPEIVRRWITERCDVASVEGDSREFARREAAIQLARSAGSSEAFSVLLNYGLTYKGYGLVQSANALTEATLNLINDGETAIVGRLIEKVTLGEAPHQRTAAALAIVAVAEQYPSLVLPAANGLVPLLDDDSRDPYERGTLIRALGQLLDWSVPDTLLQKLLRWGRDPERWIGGSSLNALAGRGILATQYGLLTDALGLQETKTGWDLSGSRTVDWAPFIIGQLYHLHGAPFAPAVTSLIRTGDWRAMAQVIPWLGPSKELSDKAAKSTSIQEALLQRIRERQTSTYAEIEMFELLADVAPDALAAGEWAESWDSWMPVARAALADALGQATVSPFSATRALHQLQLLTGDGQYAVRRASYRALARRAMDSLYALCLSWSDAPALELRQRAAEACGWISGGEGTSVELWFRNLYEELVMDAEEPVREAAKRTLDERRRRQWAEEYWSIIRSVRDGSNEEILQTWRYADALRQIGDDACLGALQEHVSSVHLAPNLRHWILSLGKEMEKKWRETTKKWPQPWFAWQGTIEEGQGMVHAVEMDSAAVKYSVWQQPARKPSELAAWGGAVWFVPPTVAPGGYVLEVEAGWRGQILVTNTSSGVAIFSGNGQYPG